MGKVGEQENDGYGQKCKNWKPHHAIYRRADEAGF